MYSVMSCLTEEHNLTHVFLALFVLSFGGACAMVVFHRGQESTGQLNRRIWAGAAGVVTGLSIWATHFIAMLGYKPGFEVVFDGWITLISAAIAICGFILTSQILISSFSVFRRLLCAVIATTTVASMHFYGMSALNASVLLEINSTYAAWAVGLSGALFVITYTFGMSEKTIWRNIVGWGTTTLAVVTLHFVGSTQMNVFPINGLAEPSLVLNSGGLTAILSVGVGIIILFAAFAASMDSILSVFRSRERFKLSFLADSAFEALFIVSSEGKVIRTNPAAAKLLNHDADDMVDQDIASIFNLTTTHDGHVQYDEDLGEIEFTRSDGKHLVVDMHRKSFVRDKESFAIYAARDITERRAQDEKIRTLAYCDHLTRLPNRVSFQNELEKRLETSANDAAILLIDLDGFKDVNDQFGHGVGDGVLKQVAARLTDISSEEIVARLGGDEFAVICDRDRYDALADDLIDGFKTPIEVGGRKLSIGLSIGVAVAGQGRANTVRIMTSADRALYAAKEAGRGQYRIYDAQLHSAHESRRDLEKALKQALSRDEFVLHYQPKVDAKTREIVGYEALIRWSRPEVGLVYPDNFIPLAEQSLLINEIGEWTIREGCRRAAYWSEHICVSVNLSAKQVLDPNLEAIVISALEETNLTPSRLELEITETALIRNTQLAGKVIERLKAIGVKIALDDFGIGYSSMSYVQQFPFDRIKIDRSFVMGLNGDKKSLAIIKSIILLGQALNIPVVAEGVETEEQAIELASIACHELQGYLIGRPAEMALEKRLSDQDELVLVSKAS